MTVYRKNRPQNLVTLSTGKSIRFEDVNGTGFLRTEDARIITEMELAMKEQRGGIYNSTQEEYDAALNKKKVSLPKRSSLLDERQTAGIVTAQQPQLPPELVEAVRAIEVTAPEPAPAVISESFTPKTGKRK